MIDPGPRDTGSASHGARVLRSVPAHHRPAPLMAARFLGLLLPAHPANFKVGWPPGPFIMMELRGPVQNSRLIKACTQLTRGSLRGSFTPLTSNPPYANRGRAKSRCHNTARGDRYPTPAFFRVRRNPERSAPHVIATPSWLVPRVGSDISCRGTHLHSWSHPSRYCRSLCDHKCRLFPQI